jgi:transcriptional regulator with XRE-family HTH domain
MRFGENLKYLMKSRKISGEILGKLLGKSKSAISTYIHGTISPSIEDLVLIRNTFQIDLESLFFKDLTKENVAPIEVPRREGILETFQIELADMKKRVAQLEKQLLTLQAE